MLREHGASDASTILCLVNPEPNGEYVIDWSIVAHSVPSDEQEAVVTRRVLSGFLPIGCLQCDPSWRLLLDTKFVPPEYLDLYTAFAQSEAAMIVRTLEGKLHPDDGWMTATTWEDRRLPRSAAETSGAWHHQGRSQSYKPVGKSHCGTAQLLYGFSGF